MNGWNYVEGNPVNWVDPSGYWPNEMLDTFLGENWESVYFFGDCINDGIFAGRDKLYQFLISENTYDPAILSLVTLFFLDARTMSLAGLPFDADSPVDAMGVSIRGSGGGIFYGGGSGEALLNLTAGELSVFVSGGGGAIFGAQVSFVGGPFYVRGLSTNADYRNYFGSVGIAGGHVMGATPEIFFGAPKAYPVKNKTSGVFIGIGPVEGLGIYGGYDFFYELFRVNAAGYHPLPDPFDYHPEYIIPIITDDILGTLYDLFSP
jgi:hypothetical protein